MFKNASGEVIESCSEAELKEILEGIDDIDISAIKGSAIEEVIETSYGKSSGKIGDFSNLQGSTVDEILDRIPDEAVLRELRSVEGGSTEGFEFKWVQDEKLYRVRVHNADPSAPAGSNAANGWIVRINKAEDISILQ